MCTSLVFPLSYNYLLESKGIHAATLVLHPEMRPISQYLVPTLISSVFNRGPCMALNYLLGLLSLFLLPRHVPAPKAEHKHKAA